MEKLRPENAHIVLGYLAMLNAYLPMIIYQYIKTNNGFIEGSTFWFVWMYTSYAHLALWAAPAILFPFTFDYKSNFFPIPAFKAY